MLSLYINIPFCEKKCKYCNFDIIPVGVLNNKDNLIKNYLESLKSEISEIGKLLEGETKQELTTLYFGGGTPSQIGKDNLIELIEYVDKYFDLDNLGELSIELNPFPTEKILDLIQTIQKKYTKFPRIRRSIGIQTFDSEILEESGRMYSFPAIRDFMRDLQKLKYPNSVFNFDFIAFGKFNKTKKGNFQLWDQVKLDFLYDFVNSGFPDGFSIYTLELFSGSERYAKYNKPDVLINCEKYGTEDDVYSEFSFLKDLVLDGGFKRFEISNFASPGKSSIHNRTYREMDNYIGIGTSASSFVNINSSEGQKLSPFFEKNNIEIKKNIKAVRRTNTNILADYIKGNRINPNETVLLDERNYIIEKFFLGLRTDQGIKDIGQYIDVLDQNRETKIKNFVKEDLVIYDENNLKLTDKGMDVYNGIITELLDV